MSGNDLLESSRRYVESTCIPAERLAAPAALTPVLPAPTYRVYAAGIASPIRSIGTCEGPFRAYYGRAVPWWLRRAAEFQRDGLDVAQAMRGWLGEDLARVLRERAADAHRFAWGHLVAADGTIDAAALAREVETLFADWLDGGWCVCLREFDGHHLVTKESERARIHALTDEGRRATLDPAARHALLDAIARLESVVTPFAPYERPHGTPGLFIDAMEARYCPRAA
jgi:hypothetical protein